MIIAIDGPSGSGKSSTARGVARRLGLGYLDTGAMYRAMTWLALHEGIDLDDQDAVTELVRGADLEIGTDPDDPSVRISGHDVTAAIRAPEISAQVSKVATNLDARALLVADQQRRVHASGGMVAEGRDITTVIAPDAEVRVLLVADPAARIARREAELGSTADTAAVTDQVVRRDRDDAQVAAFTEAADGVTVVDSTHLDLDQVIDTICAMVTGSGPSVTSR